VRALLKQIFSESEEAEGIKVKNYPGKAWVLKVFWLVIDNNSFLRIDKLLDYLEEVIETVYFFEKGFIVSDEFIQKVMGQNICQ
jgi:hypothetical protein